MKPTDTDTEHIETIIYSIFKTLVDIRHYFCISIGAPNLSVIFYELAILFLRLFILMANTIPRNLAEEYTCLPSLGDVNDNKHL